MVEPEPCSQLATGRIRSTAGAGPARGGAGDSVKRGEVWIAGGSWLGPAVFASWERTAPPPPSSPSPTRLAAVRLHILRPRAVVRRFLRDGNVMGMTLLHRRPAHHDEAGTGA